MSDSTAQAAQQLRLLVLGLSGGGKSSFVSGFAANCGVDSVRPRISHSSARGTIQVNAYSINDILLTDTAGMNDPQGLDDRFVRSLRASEEFSRGFHAAIYCYRATRRDERVTIPYGTMFGVNLPVILVIADYPSDEEKEEALRHAQLQVEAQQLVVRDHFFLPPLGLQRATDDMTRIVNRVQQFRNNPNRIEFTPPRLSANARDLVQTKKRKSQLEGTLPGLRQSLADARERIEQVFSSAGMGNGAESSGNWSCPGGRTIVRFWVEEPSTNDNENNGFSRFTRVNETTVHYHARMPNQIGPFWDRKNQWRDGIYRVAHEGPVESIRAQITAAETEIALCDGHLTRSRERLPDLYADVDGNWEWYLNKFNAEP